MLSHSVWFFAAPWTVAHQAPLSVGLPRQEYWSAVPLPSPRDLRDPGIEPTSLLSPALTDGFFTTTLSHLASHLNVLHLTIFAYIYLPPNSHYLFLPHFLCIFLSGPYHMHRFAQAVNKYYRYLLNRWLKRNKKMHFLIYSICYFVCHKLLWTLTSLNIVSVCFVSLAVSTHHHFFLKTDLILLS